MLSEVDHKELLTLSKEAQDYIQSLDDLNTKTVKIVKMSEIWSDIETGLIGHYPEIRKSWRLSSKVIFCLRNVDHKIIRSEHNTTSVIGAIISLGQRIFVDEPSQG